MVFGKLAFSTVPGVLVLTGVLLVKKQYRRWFPELEMLGKHHSFSGLKVFGSTKRCFGVARFLPRFYVVGNSIFGCFFDFRILRFWGVRGGF